jgi:hypothetical protein
MLTGTALENGRALERRTAKIRMTANRNGSTFHHPPAVTLVKSHNDIVGSFRELDAVKNNPRCRHIEIALCVWSIKKRCPKEDAESHTKLLRARSEVYRSIKCRGQARDVRELP